MYAKQHDLCQVIGETMHKRINDIPLHQKVEMNSMDSVMPLLAKGVSSRVIVMLHPNPSWGLKLSVATSLVGLAFRVLGVKSETWLAIVKGWESGIPTNKTGA